MQAYGRGFARVYNLLWTGFARQAAPAILGFYESAGLGQANAALLDLCCGSGQLAVYFLERGYRVVGVDLSPAMLSFARENAAKYVAAGQARFIQADAADFSLDEQVGLAVSTYDALNHLDGLPALKGCFACVYPSVVEGGHFIFDLNTRLGLRRWNNLLVDDSRDEVMLVTQGIFDPHSERAITRISGFVQIAGERYERFEETVYNTAFDLQAVREALLEVGWREVHFARLQDLATPLAEPEQEGRVFIVARK